MDSPDPSLIPFYAAQSNAQVLLYCNYYCQYVGSSQNLAMSAWCVANGIDPETMYLHYATPTTVEFGDGNGAISLPGAGGTYSDGTPAPLGTRVPTYGWYRNVGLTYKTGIEW